MNYVRIKFKGKRAMWAEKLSNKAYREVDKNGEWGLDNEMHIILAAPEDISWERPARENKKYGELEIIESGLNTRRVRAGFYIITRNDDGEQYKVYKRKKLSGETEWSIERQSDFKLDHASTLSGAKLTIGKWRYI